MKQNFLSINYTSINLTFKRQRKRVRKEEEPRRRDNKYNTWNLFGV